MPDPLLPSDAADILTVAVIYDDREVSVAAAIEWANALNTANITKREAIDAVRAHYLERPDTRIRPGHLIPIVRAARLAARDQAAIRAAIDPPGRGNVVRGEAGLARVREIINAARLRVAAQEAGLTRDRGTIDETRSRFDRERLVTRRDKIVHPSGDDGGDGTAWAPDDDAVWVAPTNGNGFGAEWDTDGSDR